MKLNLLFIVFFSGFFFTNAQSLDEIKHYADEQYALGNYDLALKEYQRVFLFDRTHKYNDIFFKIARIFDQRQNYEKALMFYKLSAQAVSDDSLKNEMIFDKVKLKLKHKKFYPALADLFDLPSDLSPYFQSKLFLYEGIAYYGLGQYDKAENSFTNLLSPQGKDSLRLIFNDLLHIRKKYDPGKIETMSIFLPSLGQFYLGEWKEGLNSLILLTAIGYYAGYTAVQYTLFEGLIIYGTWFHRYYSGGYKKAKVLAIKRIQKEEALAYQQILRILRQYNKWEHP